MKTFALNGPRFFNRMDRVLRRSLGVSETAPTDETVKPAPPVDPELPSEESVQSPLTFSDLGDDKLRVEIPDNMKDKVREDMILAIEMADKRQLHIDMEEMEDDETSPGHDEL